MKITFTGRHVDFPPAQMEKLEAHFAKLSKLLDRRGEREAHIVLSHERHLHQAEVTVNYHNHSLVGIASDADPMTAVHDAVMKLEKQAVKVREKWRDDHRGAKPATTDAGGSPQTNDSADSRAKVAQIHRVRLKRQLRPMTLDEALIELDGRSYLVYCDAQTDVIQLLVRRTDGDLDLVEV